MRSTMVLIVLTAVLARPAGAGDAPSDARAFVDAHTRVRERHCAPPLRWSKTLEAEAKRWAQHLRSKGCALEHSRGRYGENLAGGTHGSLDAAAVVDMWAGEGARYDFRRGGFSMSTGHFTQVVWRGTSELGCARASCGGIDVFVCEYDPPGNVEGQYRDNVRASGCR
jgi:uncharacterized protein YkwD